MVIRPLAVILAAALLSACAGNWDSLKPGVERACDDEQCALRGTAEQIDRYCRKRGKRWDNGDIMHNGDGKRVGACTVFDRRGIRYKVWLVRGEEFRWAHERCHIREFQTGRNEHWRCAGFGFDRKGNRVSYIERPKNP